MISFLFIDSERVWRGGQAQLFTLIEGLHARGHPVHLICIPRTSLESRARDLGISVHPVNIRCETGLIAMIHLIMILRKIRPDILAFNTPKPILIGNMASRFVRTGATIIFRRVSFPLNKTFISRLKYTLGIDGIIAISSSIKSRLQEGGVPESLIKIIYEGIDLTPFPKEPPAADSPDNSIVTVGTVAHLSREKGLNHLIEAASLIPGVRNSIRFMIVGDGTCMDELKNLVHEKGLDSCFEFTGFRTDSSLLMKNFDLFVLPSISEGLSSAIIEAMASFLPVIASDVGGIPELIQDGHNGFLIPPADSSGLARAIQKLADDPVKRRQMGIEGRKKVEKEFTLERKILETEKLCDTLLEKSGKAAEGD